MKLIDDQNAGLAEGSNQGTIRADLLGRQIEVSPQELLRRYGRINATLVERVENRIDDQGAAYSLFQATLGLETQVRQRTAELKTALSDLERTNAELVAAKNAAEKANSSKTRFLAAAGHDLLQPLYAAQLSVSTLADTTVKPENVTLVKQVERALVTIEAYLRSILDISKLDAGGVTPSISAVDLSEVFESLDADFRPIVERKNLKLRFRPTNLHVESDPILLRRILQNFVSNAVRYTQRGGVVVGARIIGDDVMIEVADTGVGIESGEKKRIFDEFYRCPSAEPVYTGEGLGLGLSIVQRMAQTLGHDIQVRSHPGRGSRFAVTAALAEPPAPAGLDSFVIESWLRASDLTGRRFLLVENDPDVLEATRCLLAQWGADVLTATDIASLRARLADTTQNADAKPLDAIVADFHLDRGATGLDAIEIARAATGARLPSVIVTADQSADVMERVRASGCEILRKPVKPAQLRAVLAHLLG